MKNLLAGASLLPFLCVGIVAHAADAPGVGEASEVIVTGTRQVGVKAEDSAAPIQVVGARGLTLTGNTELATSLAVSVPSLNIQTNGGDAAAVNIQAALRGVSPNDTLVLVDGKRRHGTANLAVNGGSPYSGSATTDLSFIPIGSIDHVEVLTDGAAAQYGTDAIAGVINIITKKGSAGTLDITGGQYYNNNGTHFQGERGSISINKGFLIGDKGYFNVTLENRYHNFSVLGIGDKRFQGPTGALLPGLTFPNSNVTKFATYPHENALNGDPQFNIYDGFVSAGYQIAPEAELYMTGSFGYREAQHYENYRTPSKIQGKASDGVTVFPLPNGFDPKEKFDEKDYSITGGVKGTIAEWHYDLSGTYGGNNEQVYTIDSANLVVFAQQQALVPSTKPVTPQTAFYDGEYKATELTLNADFSRDFAVNMASPLSVAFGGEYRRNTYGIGAGEPSSYIGGGAQSFSGYTPQDQGDFTRTNYAGYIDLSIDPIQNLHIDLAGRYEHYTDFGSTEVGKATVRYDFNPKFAIRGTVSNGFRAPTLAEEHYSGTNVSPSSADVQLPPNSAAAQLAGFQPLKPELSQNYSIGFVAHPIDNMQVTFDAYQINIHKRILVSGFIYGICCAAANPQVISQGVVNAIANRGVILDTGLSYSGISLFANAANTRTDGFEITANYASDFGDYGHVDWTLGGNYNKTQITKSPPLPAAVQNVAFGQTVFFTKTSAGALTTGTPRYKVILQAYYTYKKFAVNLRETIYGQTSQFSANNVLLETVPVTGITDLDIAYKFTPAIKISVGANDLFNQTPPLEPLNAGGVPVGGGRVFNVPLGIAPYNQNGGYYYGRVVVTF